MNRALDLDGLYSDFNTAYRQLIGEQTGKWLPEISNVYPTKWNYHEDAGLTKEELEGVWNTIKNTDFWETLKPYPEAASSLTLLRELRGEGDNIYFITSRPGKYAKHLTEFWLDAQGFECPTVLLSTQKGPVCVGLEIDIFVDDRPENCQDVMAFCGSSTKVFLLDRPYNREFDHPRISRVMSLMDPRLYKSGEVKIDEAA